MRVLLRLFVLSLLFLPIHLAAHAGPVGLEALPDDIQRQMDRTGKQVLDHTVYDTWRTLDDEALTADGEWVTFRYVPGEGDAELILRRTDREEIVSVDRGGAVTFTPDDAWAVFLIQPAHAAVRQARRDEVNAG